MSAAPVAGLVVRWQAQHGRSELPWQQTRDPYRVWLSEIMLQQTQVATVLDYYARFLARFPDVQTLAAASSDEVLALWSGLGYYSRARNLHRCAQQVVQVHGGQFPRTAEALADLPGIGRSTAGAIAAFCFGQRAPILDANVKRVLTRLLGFGGDLAQAAQERTLWQHAEALLPRTHLQQSMPRYTQGLMDLGALVCLPRNPQCAACPLQAHCVARAEGEPERYPVRTCKLARKAQAWWLLQLEDGAGRIWFERRPERGIWAGLHCLPVFGSRAALLDGVAQAGGSLGIEYPALLHVLTHRDLHLHRVTARVPQPPPGMQGGGWHHPQELAALGLPAPVRRLLQEA
ncbi:A/G-specific adenine glycosylase [Comamonas granuli]|uniref:A/G-specific adenine glycosylase n=1 Tax=Comamonas granuli TaxID=290309 RepID=UPI0005A729FD|nr:A/G-specific adenine glycosylase [Comamonas granuli]